MSATVPLQKPTSAATEYQSLAFFVRQRLMGMQTATVVQVQAVHGGGLGAVGTVDVLPLVNQVDGAGNQIPHKTIYARPYVRWQGGDSAVILDPVEGDIGLCVFASRDISSVLASGQQSPPASGRAYAFADGLYVGVTVADAPSQYVQFLVDGDGNPQGIKIVSSGGDITLNGVTIDTSGNISTPGTIDATGDITGDSVSLHSHVHSGVTTGSGDTGPPT